MKLHIHPEFTSQKKDIVGILHNFEQSGTPFGNGDRNRIKLFKVSGKTINVKAFKIPNLINKLAYAYFRKSKARRSYEFACFLLEKGIGTPHPVAFLENHSWLGLEDSYYASEHLEADLTYRELVRNPEYPNRETILRQFAEFTYELHKNGIEFKDHSPGNTLIVKESEQKYAFYLVDLNRMRFHQTMPFDVRMKNFSRLTPYKEMVRTMSTAYSEASGEPFAEVFTAMWAHTEAFQRKHARKKRWKRKLRV